MIQDPNIPIRRKSVSIRQYINEKFRDNHIDSMVVSLDDFDEKYHFNFLQIEVITEEKLIEFLEYSLNVIVNSGIHYPSDLSSRITDFENIIAELVSRINCKIITNTVTGLYNIIKSDASIETVANLVDKDLSQDVLMYTHYSLEGDISGKKKILLGFANWFDSKQNRDALKQCNKELETDLGMIFNNCNLRHNNFDPLDAAKYKPNIEKLSSEELERLYDETYKLCLLAVMEKECATKKDYLKDIKNKIQTA